VEYSFGFIAAATVAIMSFKNNPTGTSQQLQIFFEGGTGLRLLTVFAIILATVFLGTIGKLNEGASALLSGVAGYVLGGLQHERRNANEPGNVNELGNANEPRNVNG
jgi:hypothetical protein